MEKDRKPTFKLKKGHSVLKDKMGVGITDREEAEFLYCAGLVPQMYVYVDGKSKKVIATSVPSDQYSFGKKLLEWKREREEKEKAKRGRKFGSRG
jgi:hypothetical protein